MEERYGQPQLTPPAPDAPSPAASLDKPRSEAQKQVDQRTALIATLVVVAIVVLLIVVVALLSIDPARTANIRDIVIILSAFGGLVMSIILGVLLVILIFRVQELISFLRGEIVPMMAEVQTTLKTVRGTTTFVSDNVAKPTIKVASFVAGVQQMARSANDKMKGRTGRYDPTSNSGNDRTYTASGAMYGGDDNVAK